MRELFELPADRRDRRRRAAGVSQCSQRSQCSTVIPFGTKASIPLAGKCRREGCVSKRHFAAPGVVRRVGGGDIIAREEPRERESEKETRRQGAR